MTRVLYPGSFDPIHNGHVEIIETAAEVFDEVVIAAVGNPQKASGMFSLDERAELMREVLAHLPNVQVAVHTSLVVDLAAELDVNFIVKGLRSMSDFENELRMAQLNKSMTGVETMFLPSTSSSGYIASSYVREIARLGGDVTSMVPGPVADRLRAKMGNSD